jgi:putative membrane protein insertion efficiency factor
MQPPRRRWKAWGIAFAFALLFAIDLARPVESQWSTRALLGSIHLYQATLSPHMSELGVSCRFRPTCSHYGAGAIAKYGALKGTALAIWRIARCGPWTPAGTYDPP